MVTRSLLMKKNPECAGTLTKTTAIRGDVRGRRGIGRPDLTMAPVIEVWIGLQARLLRSIEEAVMQHIAVARVLHLDRATNSVHALLVSYTAAKHSLTLCKLADAQKRDVVAALSG